ncbi:MAG: MerR family transcriptional regulator [Myxococcales bacterium]|nr:MerR family transcriptional regulator [Myxococcales bacterium]MCB9526562.1 MerR family transcriptional regulator [Myxococcales bacterium]
MSRYRIQAVARLSGVTSATLRAWERRYGLPEPERGENGYRLYSEVDLARVQRMVALIEAGHAPSDAARLARTEPVVTAEAPIYDPAEAVRDALLSAVRGMDAEGARLAIHRALTLGPAWRIHEEVFVPVLATIGEAWAAGTLTVGHEHFASEAIGGALRDLLRLMDPPSGARTLLLACVDEEQHSLPLLGVALMGAHAGWRPVLLGARTPPQALAAAATQLKPDAVALSATIHRPGLAWGDYAKAVGRTPWIAGGRAARTDRAALESLGAVVGDYARTLQSFLAGLTPRAVAR